MGIDMQRPRARATARAVLAPYTRIVGRDMLWE